MSGVSLPVSRPMGRALIVGNASCRSEPLAVMQRQGFHCAELDDPYAAMAELCRRPLVYRALILSLASLYREELPLIGSIKRRFPHMEIWLTHTDGRQAALAEAMRLGADGLVGEEGLHRTGPGSPAASTPTMIVPPPMAGEGSDIEEVAAMDNDSVSEPVLTADELRALLQEQPDVSPGTRDG